MWCVSKSQQRVYLGVDRFDVIGSRADSTGQDIDPSLTYLALGSTDANMLLWA